MKTVKMAIGQSKIPYLLGNYYKISNQISCFIIINKNASRKNSIMIILASRLSKS